MSPPLKHKGKAFWSRVEEAGEAMELGLRLFLGFLFACLLSAAAWAVGNQVWVGLAIIISLLLFPIGFLVGFFWLEVKFMIRLFISLIG